MSLSAHFDKRPRPSGRHRVAAVHFEHGNRSDVAPIECDCGWSGTVGGFDRHKGGFGVARAATEVVRPTHCPQGHDMATAHVTAAGRRQCRICRREATNRYAARKRQERMAA